jgi:DNA-binding Lrp family transcriptional regulator
MVTAYILVKANTGEADRLLNAVSDLDGVVEAHLVAGDVDLIAKVDVDSPADVKEIAANGIQKTAGVEDTETYISMS